MKGIIVIKGDGNKNTGGNIRAHVAMRLGRFDKIERKSVGDSIDTDILIVKTRKKTFRELQEELNEFYPDKCMFITKKALA